MNRPRHDGIVAGTMTPIGVLIGAGSRGTLADSVRQLQSAQARAVVARQAP